MEQNVADDDAGQGGGEPRSWLDRLASAITGEPRTRSELIELLRSSEQRELLDAEALSIIEGALTVSEMHVREIMIPRSQVVMISADMEPAAFLPRIIESGHSRFPVTGDSADDIIGILLAKDLLSLVVADKKTPKFNLKDILRKHNSVPESKRLNILLQEFRTTHQHLAVVYDEHGGVSGIVTIEDVLEQIVGDIEDEFDYDEEDFIKEVAANDFTVKALTPLEDFNDRFDCDFRDNTSETIGGVVTRSFGHVPKRDEEVDIEGFQFKVLNSDNRRIRLLQLTPPKRA